VKLIAVVLSGTAKVLLLRVFLLAQTIVIQIETELFIASKFQEVNLLLAPEISVNGANEADVLRELLVVLCAVLTQEHSVVQRGMSDSFRCISYSC
jgi:hypothetical protein